MMRLLKILILFSAASASASIPRFQALEKLDETFPSIGKSSLQKFQPLEKSTAVFSDLGNNFSRHWKSLSAARPSFGYDELNRLFSSTQSVDSVEKGATH